MNTLKIKLVSIMLIFLSSLTFAQDKWSLEFRPGINFPTEDFGSSNIQTGFGFEVIIAYSFIEYLSGFTGWGYNTFEIEDSSLYLDETGYTFGLQFIHPFGSSENISYLIRVGTIYNHLELEDNDNNYIDDSGHGFGWQIGAGLQYNLIGKWSLHPTIRYRSLSRDLKIGETLLSIDLYYITFGLGISKTF